MNAGAGQPPLSELAGAIVQAGVLASTLPLGIGGSVVRIARAGLMLVLVPIFLACDQSRAGNGLLTELLRGVIIGGALGLSAMIVFGAVVGAGSAIDAALTWTPLPDRSGSGSPVGFLYQAAFTVALFSTGGFSAIVAIAAHASAELPLRLMTLSGACALGKLCLAHSVALAAPALLAQMFASLLAGVAARAAPQIGGILMSAPLIWSAVALTVMAGSSMLFVTFASIIRHLIMLYTH